MRQSTSRSMSRGALPTYHTKRQRPRADEWDDDADDALLDEPFLTGREDTGALSLDADSQFNRAIRAIPMLSNDEERRLGERVLRGDASAKQQLFEANLRWIRSLALHYSAGHAEWSEDYVAEACAQVWRHMDQFDYRTSRFVTWASWWVRQACGRATSQMVEPVRRPVHAADRAKRFNRIVSRLMQERNAGADAALYADALDELEAIEARLYDGRMRAQGRNSTRAQLVTDATRERLVAEDARNGTHGVVVVSIQGMQDRRAKSIAGGGGLRSDQDTNWIDAHVVNRPLWAQGADVVAEEALAGAMRRELSAKVAEVCARVLTQREIEVVALRMHGYTLEKTGRALGFTRERSRQIEAGALAKLRKPHILRELRALQDGTAWGETWAPTPLWPAGAGEVNTAVASDEGGAA